MPDPKTELLDQSVATEPIEYEEGQLHVRRSMSLKLLKDNTIE